MFVIKVLYKFILSGIAINDNPLVGMVLLALFDIIAYKIAYRMSNNSPEHWISRMIILILMSAIFIITVNVIKWIIINWILLLIFLALVIFISGIIIYVLHKENTFKN